ncbi:MAG TPA: response regulator transcription factor [Candidatus Limnocylindrales bacterium]|nr:response regulator transcription factor [Candidatus Limnocylindrales bacterium]
MRTILIVDDDARFRAQARDLLIDHEFVVVGEAVDGASAITSTRSLRPDVVLLDIGLPDVDGFTVAESLASEGSPPMVVLTSSRDARAYGRRLRNSHAIGFIPKEQISAMAMHALVDRE